MVTWAGDCTAVGQHFSLRTGQGDAAQSPQQQSLRLDCPWHALPRAGASSLVLAPAGREAQGVDPRTETDSYNITGVAAELGVSYRVSGLDYGGAEPLA
ncbi:hypothetical protein NDU88_006678 [Pleurodeles waltl]|uniref:Uncharacterized protein n=1 Tax=Pleurodeles waltl TaxID=8319 RepID=A0AAV7MGM2_PLEWA|nr:hypothetical protein NDU88_006678 [Pleurodeles waltl]